MFLSRVSCRLIVSGPYDFPSSTVKTEASPKMALQDYLEAFERRVDLSVERTFGDVPYFKKGETGPTFICVGDDWAVVTNSHSI